jgi:RNA polymerase-binding transcription factor DksA
MSDKMLSKEELKVCEENLLKERQKSLDYINKLNDNQKDSVRDSSGDASAYAIHQADHGSDTYYRENQVLMLEKEHQSLKKINAGLKRVYEGTYGMCEICGKRIQPKRLEFVPDATYCIECRSAEDIKDKKKNRSKRK